MPDQPEAIRVVIADDHPIFRDGLRRLLSAEPGFEVIGEAGDGHEAVARTARSIFPLADAAGDEPTADLLTQRLTVHEQTAWMLRSLLED